MFFALWMPILSIASLGSNLKYSCWCWYFMRTNKDRHAIALGCGWLADGTTKEKDLRAKHGAVIKACIRSASIISCPFVQHALRQENDMHFQVGVAASTLLERTFPAKTSWCSIERHAFPAGAIRPRSMQTGCCQG